MKTMAVIVVASVIVLFVPLTAGWSSDLDIWTASRASEGSAWGIPGPMGGAVNTIYNENNPEISADGLMLLFDSNRPGGRGSSDIYFCSRADVNSPWNAAQNLSPFINTSSNEAGPSLSSDGLILFFHSTRSGGEGGWDIWYSMRSSVDDPWSTPVNAGTEINTGGNDWTPEISLIDDTLYFASSAPGQWELYAADLLNIDYIGGTITFDSAQALGFADAIAPDVSQDGLSLYYESVFANDIILSTRGSTSSAWSGGSPVVLTTPSDEAPSISDDELTLYYVSIPEPGFAFLGVTCLLAICKWGRRVLWS